MTSAMCYSAAMWTSLRCSSSTVQAFSCRGHGVDTLHNDGSGILTWFRLAIFVSDAAEIYEFTALGVSSGNDLQ